MQWQNIDRLLVRCNFYTDYSVLSGGLINYSPYSYFFSNDKYFPLKMHCIIFLTFRTSAGCHNMPQHIRKQRK